MYCKIIVACIHPFQLIPNLDTPTRDRFRYTINSNGILNDRQRQFYEQNGFLVIPNLVKHDLIDECQQRFLDIVDGKVEKGKSETKNATQHYINRR